MTPITPPTTTTITTPATPFKYSAAAQVACTEIALWLEQHGKTKAWLSRTTRLSTATVSQILNGKYPSDPTDQIKVMQDSLATHTERAADAGGEDGAYGAEGKASRYVKNSVYALTKTVCQRTRKHGNFGIVTGFVGIGKTAALKEYARTNSNTVLLEANPDMTPGVLLRDLLGLIDAACPKSLDEKFSALVATLKDTTTLIVIDEAETIQPRCLHYLRRLRDKAGVGIVLVGTERLLQIIKPVHGTFDQIRSRVGMFPPVIKAILRDDADDITRAHFPELEIEAETLETLWSYTQGSARMLTENIIPALVDYGIKKGRELNTSLIHEVAQKILFLAKPKKDGV